MLAVTEDLPIRAEGSFIQIRKAKAFQYLGVQAVVHLLSQQALHLFVAQHIIAFV